MPVRVFHLVDDLAPFGDSHPLLQLLPQLTELGHEHRLLSIHGTSNSDRREPAVAPRSLGARWGLDPIAWGRLQYMLGHEKPDIVHAWGVQALKWLLASRRGNVGGQWVATLFETSPLSPRLAHRAARRLDRWITTSETAHAAALEAGLPEARSLVVRRGAPLPPEPRSREHVLAEWGLPLDSPLVVTTGRLEHQAQLKELIWAADMVRVLHPGVRLVIVGEGPARRGLEYFARTAAVPANILFAGNRSPDDLYPHCRAYWAGTEGGDTRGHLLAAMACGVPVVASDVPLHREWIDPGKQGYLAGLSARADWTRVTDQLLTDEELYRRVGEAARQRVAAEHSLGDEASELDRVYRR
jgi:glycosyltransferase involved in cell wall biosynthesis